MAEHAVVAQKVVDALGAICLALPETHEEKAWVGTRWRVGTRTFAHVLAVDSGGPLRTAAPPGATARSRS